MIRTRLLIVGLGVALLFAGAPSAQEITNTQFADGPYATPFTQPVPAYQATDTSTDSQAAKASTNIRAGVNASANAPTERPYPAERVMWIGIALVWVAAAFGIYFASLGKRFGPSLPSVASSQFVIKLDWPASR